MEGCQVFFILVYKFIIETFYTTAFRFYKCLFLQNNKLTRIDESSFKTLTNLKSLLLESNNILTFDRNALIGLSNIELVCLSNNPISILGQSIIKDICKTSPRCLVQINGECDV